LGVLGLWLDKMIESSNSNHLGKKIGLGRELELGLGLGLCVDEIIESPPQYL
jgi:hypothetical protein